MGNLLEELSKTKPERHRPTGHNGSCPKFVVDVFEAKRNKQASGLIINYNAQKKEKKMSDYTADSRNLTKKQLVQVINAQTKVGKRLEEKLKTANEKYEDLIDFIKENEMYESLQEWWSCK